MYTADHSTWVNEEAVSSGLCGRTRPGHFRGVCTVVLKLFAIVQPQFAVFGRKDFQQCAVIARMVRDVNLPVRLVFAPTVREPDGLAMSSRNVYLRPEEREQAPVLRRALLAAQALFGGRSRRAKDLREAVLKALAEAPIARVDYIEIVNPATLETVDRAERGSVIALAVFFGKTRLIDNLELR